MMLLTVQLHSFTCGYLASPEPFVETIVLFLLNGLALLVSVKIYFWALCFILLVYMSYVSSTLF